MLVPLNTVAEVAAFLERFAVAQHVRSLPPMTEADYAAAEQAFADAPPAAEWTDADVDALFAESGDFGDDCDPESEDGF